MVISPRPMDQPKLGFAGGDWITRFEARTLEDIRAHGRNSREDDRAFAAVARLSEINLALYRATAQPMVRALSTEASAKLTKAMNPLRLSYTMFDDANPWMAGIKAMATIAAANRKPVAEDNPFLAVQARVSDQIIAVLEKYRIARDDLQERAFFGFYGSPVVQAMLGISAETEVRQAPGVTPDTRDAQRAERSAQAAMLHAGGFDAALVRAALWVAEADRSIDERSALALNVVRQKLMHLSLAAFQLLVRNQFFVLQLDGDGAVEALAGLVPDPASRAELIRHVETIASAGAPPSAATRARLVRLSNVLPVALEKATDVAPTARSATRAPKPARKPLTAQ
jgi:hypothetical protein